MDPERGLPNAPADPFGRSGTYMVWRKLYQDVALFRHVLREAAALYGGGDHEKLAAKVVGRWPNGTPLGRLTRRTDPPASMPGRRAPTPSATPPTTPTAAAARWARTSAAPTRATRSASTGC